MAKATSTGNKASNKKKKATSKKLAEDLNIDPSDGEQAWQKGLKPTDPEDLEPGEEEDEE